MAAITRYVNPSTGTDDLAAGRGESSGDPWASLSYAVTQTAALSSDDVTIECAGSAADTVARVDFNGHAALSLTINGPTKTSGAYETGIYRLELTDIATAALYYRSTSTPLTINNLQVQLTQSSTGGTSILTTSGVTGSSLLALNHCYFHIINNTAATASGDGVQTPSQPITVRMNNVVVRLTGTLGTGTRGFDCPGASLFNCLADGAHAVGIYRPTVGTNCVSIGATDSYSTVGSTFTTSFGDDGAGDTGVTNISDWTAEFTDVASGDYSLKSSSPNLVDGGTDVSASNGGVTVDLLGQSRGATWDGGPTEYISVGGGGSVKRLMLMGVG